MAEHLTWGILGAGRIAGVFARGLAKSRTGKLLAIGSRCEEKAQAFGQEFGAERRYGSYTKLLADRDVQAVYIATPHPQHAQWAIAAAQAGKGILCEKPITLDLAGAQAVVQAARRNSVFLMEAFMYRCHPQTAKLVELLRGGAIGQVRLIRASFGFHAPFNAEGRLFAKALGGGAILDVGCYCVSAARLIAGVAAGRDFAEPLEIKASGHLGSTGVDEWALASLKFPGDILAQLATSISLTQDNQLSVFGSEGQITLPWPWAPAREGGQVRILLKRDGEQQAQEIVVATDEYLYGLEADAVAAGWEDKQAAPPAMTWEDTLGNMRVLDAWRREIGLTYESL
jgi:predicted dehydrogenase